MTTTLRPLWPPASPPPSLARPLDRARRARRGAWGVALALLATGGCSADIFDVAVELAPQKIPVDFGQRTGVIPMVPCTVQNMAVCGDSQPVPVMTGLGRADVGVGCDAALGRCYAQAIARLTYPIDVLQDESFTNKVGRRAVSSVRMLDISYAVPVNTTTFDVPRMDVFVGPPGAQAEDDPGVEALDTIPPLPAHTVLGVADPRHLVVTDGSPARDLMERSIRNKVSFTLLVVLAPRLDSGAPVPAGQLEIDLMPLLGLGLR